MGKIFYLTGKSASGKDTIYRELLYRYQNLREIITWTTRPKRDGEKEGREYHFVCGEDVEKAQKNGLLVEKRDYDTAFGIWTYATVDDGSVDLEKNDYAAIGTLVSCMAVKKYFGEKNVSAIYLSLDDGERLLRALKREMLREKPAYAEMCRRFLADEEDFTEEKLKAAGIDFYIDSTDKDECVKKIGEIIDGAFV